jgi:hypothetical protein
MPHNCSSSSCWWTRARFSLATSHLHMSEPRASLTRSHFAGSASLLPRLAFRRIPWRRLRYGYRVPASAHARLYVVDLLGHSSTCRAPTLLLRRARTALQVRPHLPHLRRPAAAPEPVRPSPKPLSHRVSNCRSRRALAPLKPTLLLFLLSRRAATWCRSYPRRLASGFRGPPAPAALRSPARLLPCTAWPLPRHALARTRPAWPGVALAARPSALRRGPRATGSRGPSPLLRRAAPAAQVGSRAAPPAPLRARAHASACRARPTCRSTAWALRQPRELLSSAEPRRQLAQPPPYRGRKGGRGSRGSAACGEEKREAPGNG